MEETVIARVAVGYAKRGLRVFPIWWAEDGRCGCGGGCASPAKHPIGKLAPRGCLDASDDPQEVAQWWAEYPDANIGIATGEDAGVVVLDIDGRTGWESLSRLVARFGELPATWGVTTGGGGWHVWFAHPNVRVANSAGSLGPGLDVRGAGGYVVAPPSIHLSGNAYRWSSRGHPSKVTLSPPPDWLTRLIGGRAETPGRFQRAPVIGPTIQEGQRNHTLTSLAGSMRQRGADADVILVALVKMNETRCKPPLAWPELARIAGSVSRYPTDAEPTIGAAR